MEQPKATLQQAWPYQQDTLNLPVQNLESVLPFYETGLGFRIDSLTGLPQKSALIARDDLQIGLPARGKPTAAVNAGFYD